MGLITGVVTDDDGGPIALAAVAVVRAPVAMPDIAALTDAEGRFAIGAPAPGLYEVGIRADGFEPASAQARVGTDGEAVLVVRLTRER